MKTLLIGDVHGLTNSYWKLLGQHKPERSIQLGDFGFMPQHQWHRTHIDGKKHKVLFGNHDDPNCLNMLHSMGDFGFDGPAGNANLFFARGAASYDRAHRVEGRDWWPEEEMTYARWQEAIDCYDRNKPRIMLSHDCPQSVRQAQFGIHDKSITSQALQTMLEIHQPELWFYGHHHRSDLVTMAGTRFRCLAELETAWLDY